jgi:hypothetical protein
MLHMAKSMAMQYPQFRAGETVRDCHGRAHTVLFQRGCQVFFEDGGWAHPTKVWRVHVAGAFAPGPQPKINLDGLDWRQESRS